jgi:hypothetical protein
MVIVIAVGTSAGPQLDEPLEDTGRPSLRFLALAAPLVVFCKYYWAQPTVMA